jgi:hypothetical protein
VPVNRLSFEPRNEVWAAHVKLETTGEMPSLVTSLIQVSTHVPTLNIENFQQVRSLTCSEGFMSLKWDNRYSAQEALRSWQSVKDLTVLVGERACNFSELTALRITSIKNDRNVMHMEVESVAKKEVVADWKLKLNHHSLTGEAADTKIALRKLEEFSVEVSQASDHSSKERRWSLLEIIAHVAKQLVSPSEWAYTNQNTKNLNWNFDETRAAPKVAELVFYDNFDSTLKCMNCFTRGTVSFAIALSGTSLQVTNYDISLNGYISGNSSYKLKRLSRGVTPVLVLALIPLGEISVAGLFTFKPSFQLKAGVSAEAEHLLDAKYGWEYNIPLNYQISGGNGVPDRDHVLPSVEASSENNESIERGFRFHSFEIANSTAARIASHITPKISLALNVLGVPASFNFNYDTSLRLEVSSGGLRICPREKYNLVAYHKHNLSLLTFINNASIRKPHIFWSKKNMIRCL